MYVCMCVCVACVFVCVYVYKAYVCQALCCEHILKLLPNNLLVI